MPTVTPGRLRRDIVRLAHRGLDVRAFSLAAGQVLLRAVPCDGVCVITVDPATLLPTGEVVVNGLPAAASARLTEIEVAEADYIKFAALARSRRPAAGLAEATGGDLDRSVRYREVKRPHGFGDELRAALVTESGTWGGVTLLHEAGRSPFAPADVRLVASIGPVLAEGPPCSGGARRAGRRCIVGRSRRGGDGPDAARGRQLGPTLDIPYLLEAMATAATTAR